ncbi:exported hypothetical protein [Desulfamplus magnetovallimortis]|uniref:PKD domain-containing protein n=1 Tax=Desulfamplus magnetovallimortis TaxID=1246637 RepID=A0A1W1HGK3_9BACT|nr:PKD domain-containing protein [Desulfamplus magnetovallimortis]SLM31512.1 exported hypothetical protein [Desulfamplus magnetovallimortis]
MLSRHKLFFTLLILQFFIVAFTGIPESGAGESGAGDLDLESINFAFDSDKPIEDLKQINRIMDFMGRDNDLILEISAHTDTHGTEAYNSELSRKRALAVKQIFLDRGLLSERILIKGNAFHVPFASNKNLEGQLLNRRTDFSIFKFVNGERDYYYRDNRFIKPLETMAAVDEGAAQAVTPAAETGPSLNDLLERINDLEELLKDKGTESASPEISSGGSTGFNLFANNAFTLSGGVGANNGELLGNVQASLFIPMNNQSFALQGGFRGDITEDFQEYQMDAGLVGKSGYFQLGCFASMKFVNLDLYEDTGMLSQINVAASRLFKRGSVGIFFTQAIKDEDVVDSHSHFEFADLYTTETYISVRDKIGVSVEYMFENGLSLYGDVGSQDADESDMFGSLRMTFPLNKRGDLRLFCQADYNNGYLEEDDNYSAVIGIELGTPADGNLSGESNSNGDASPRIRPMKVQPISYDVNTRTTVLESDVNHAPTVSIKVSTIQGTPQFEVAFQAVASDPDGTIVSYVWDFGDGTSGSGEEVTHSYSASGLYNVTLTVTDDKGATSSASTAIDALNASPEVSIQTTTLQGGYPHTVTFTASATDSDGSIISYEWHFGDGNTATGKNVTHTFKKPGTYQVELKVTDNLHAVTTSSVIVTATSFAPTSAINYKVSQNDPATFTFTSNAWDSDGEIRTWLWDLGDGTYSNMFSIEHTFAPGTYVVRLTVMDSQGMSATETVTVTVP